MNKPLASLSLDLDNKWSYMKTHGDAGWESFPSYLPIVVPRVLRFLAKRNLEITFFIVGQDAVFERNRDALRSLADAGHEIGNHSFHHEPWLHLYSPEKIAEEFSRAEAAIRDATGQVPVGFRGPGFSFSPAVLTELAERGYLYDASTFPTFLGPLARLYYFLSTQLNRAQKTERKLLFGRFREGFRKLRPYPWRMNGQSLLEIPVTTMPLLKLPIHASYLLYLREYSAHLALGYFRLALWLCRLFRVELSLLLHPLDFLGCDDECGLEFFPAMRTRSQVKVDFVGQVIDLLGRQSRIVPMREHAEIALARMECENPERANKNLPSGAELQCQD